LRKKLRSTLFRWTNAVRMWLLPKPKLGILHQHEPKSLFIPPWYAKTICRVMPSPSISVVTPSYNQGVFLERTIHSVLDQNYQPLEYIIQDGGSDDNTLEILDRYRSELTHVDSIEDRGQAHALNMGFSHSHGEIMAYLNSDDLLMPGSLAYIAEYFATHPDVDIVYGHRILIDENDKEIGRWILPPHDSSILAWVDYIPQESLFWRRRIWEKVGSSIDESFHFAMDWELLLRFQQVEGRMVRLPRFLGAFRVHSQQKTLTQIDSLGQQEMNRLRTQYLGRSAGNREISSHLIPFLRTHRVYDRLYRLGILRY